jgi:hypothetical protein
MNDGIKGLLIGAGFGACLGLWWIIQMSFDGFFFWGDIIVIGAVACGLPGYFFGDRFFDWFSDHWHWWF